MNYTFICENINVLFLSLSEMSFDSLEDLLNTVTLSGFPVECLSVCENKSVESLASRLSGFR